MSRADGILEIGNDYSNKNIKNIIMKMFPACFSYALVVMTTFLVDSFLSGFFLGQKGLTAITIGLPSYSIFITIIAALAHGAELRMTWMLGRGDSKGFRRAFASGFYLLVIVAAICSIYIFIYPDKLVAIFGGNNTTKEIRDLSSLYVKSCAWFVLFYAIGGTIQVTLGVVGYQVSKMICNFANVGLNAILSVIFVKIMPSDLKVVGMGLGTTVSTFVCIIISYYIAKRKKINITYKPVLPRLKEIKETIVSGFPASIDLTLDIAMASVIINVLLKYYGEDGKIFAIYAVVSNIVKIAKTVIQGVGYSASPLFGILYASRDKNGLKKALVESIKIGLGVTVIWCGIIYFFRPLIFRIQGMPMNEDGSKGSSLGIIFMLVYLIAYLLTVFYEATKHFGLSMYLAIIPDTVLYPFILVLFGKKYGTNVLWWAYSADFAVVLLISYIVLMIKNKRCIVPLEKIMLFDSSIKNSKMIFDYTIRNDMEDVTTISKKLYDYYGQSNVSKKTQYISALTLEEIVSDIVYNTKRKSNNEALYIDIKVIEENDFIDITVRNIAKPYNPLEYSDKKDAAKIGIKMAQKCAKDITYSYAYRMNVVNIVLDKKMV